MNQARQLTGYLQRLGAVGPKGFEGLVAQLLERLTGQRFFLASAGSQEGRDMSTGGFDGAWIAVEAKRFKSQKSFQRRELLGELLELPEGLDLWVLASTARIPDRIISVLRREAFSRGIDVETLDVLPDRLGDLQILCAAYEDVVVSFLGEESAGDFRQILRAVSHQPDFAPLLERLRERFQAGSIGYVQARAASFAYLRSAFEDSRRARVELGQPINVLENGGRHVVERRQPLEALKSWWNGWPASPRPLALLGEEGMGKTWVIASWLASRLDTTSSALPLTLFLPSQSVGTLKSLDLIASALATCTGARDARFWSRRAEAFAKRPTTSPALLLVIDGLNEQPIFDWRTLLVSLLAPPWNDRIAIAVTCRPAYWRERIAPAFRDSFQVSEVGPYNDAELASALEKGELLAANLPSTLEELLRRPRYLDLTARHWQALEQSGDVTVDRLLYEDWKDRASRKGGLFSNEEFRNLLIRLAEDHRDNLLSKREIEDLLPRGFLTGLDEIITGGILDRDSFGRYAVVPRRLIQGLGLLLASRVQSESSREPAMREVMASLLEPEADMDRKVAICRSAVTFAVLEPGFPGDARLILFEQWIGNRNLSREDIESFFAYIPASTASYLSLAERFWTTRRTNHQAQSLLIRAFVRWRENARVQQALIGACERWLSYVHLHGYRFMRGRDEVSRAELRREIEERAGQPLRPGDKFLLFEEMEATDEDTFLWLAKPALVLASLFPVVPLIPAMRRWALSRSIMGYPEEIESVSWVLRWSEEDLWPALEAAIGPLLGGSRVEQQAAWRLLWASGCEKAALLFERLPQDLFPFSHDEAAYAEDPCQAVWRREDCARCMARNDLPDRLVALKLAPHALDPDLRIDFDLRPRLQAALTSIRVDQLSASVETTFDDLDFQRMEPALAAFAPELVAETYRSLICDLPNRPEKNRHILLSELETVTILLGRRERRVLRMAWEQTCRIDNDEARESEIDLLAALLSQARASNQLKLLLSRPHWAFDDISLGLWFKRLSKRQIRSLAQGLLGSTPHDLQRKLWFLWYQPAAPVVAAVGAEPLVDLLNHADPETRGRAERWLFRSGSDEILDLAIERGHVTPSLTLSIYRFWGYPFTVRMRSRHPYEKLAGAIDLGSLSYIVRRRPYDLAVYTRDLDKAVQGAASARSETLKTAFCKQTLQAICKQHRDIVEGWIRLAVGQRDAWSPLIESCHMMFETLCEVLLARDPARGVALFRTLRAQRRRAKTEDDPTGVDVLALTLFRTPQSEHAEALRRKWLDDCITDEDLFELALAGSFIRNDEQLAELIRWGLSSDIPVKRAAALTLSGFAVHGSQSAAVLDSVNLHPKGWLYQVLERARRHLERDRWAQEWFRRFVTSPGVEESFAAFRLFLRCVDRRYWVWHRELLRSTRLSSARRHFWTGNRDRIDQAINGNEKNLEKRFLGREIPEGKVYPWLRSYLG